VVLREDIRLRLWPNNTIVEFDHSINAAIKRLRNALGESAEAPRYIETLAKRGYRFIGDVETVVPAMQPAVSNGSDSEPPAPVTPRYRILDRLGEGGMGVVYRAEDIRLSRQVALKFLPAPAAEIPSTILRRFEREARAASSLNHPHICTIYGLEDFDGQPVIAMELVHGETLSSRQIRGRIPREEALRIAVQVAGAMAEAHRKGIVHRDLKPANIMLTKSGVKVLDFGLAKMERATATDDETATISGMILGTPHYMSPEQAQGQEADARGDIFAFGVILYEMLASKRPFEGKNAAGIMAAILERDPPSLTGSVPASLDRVLRRCLAKNPEDRWQSAADLQAELEWLAESPTTEPLVAAARSRWIDWRWIAIGTLAVLSIALGGVLISQKPLRRPYRGS
jgi:serine/threonine protein kinase